MIKILSWIFGIAAMVCLFLTYQQKNRSRLIKYKLIADVCWSAHYLLLGGYGGMIPNFVGIFRELVFAQREKKKWAKSLTVPMVFIVLNLGLGVFTFKNPINILPIVASVFVTVSLWLKNPKLTKLISLPISFSFLIYDIVIGSYIGIVNESITMTSIISSLIITFKNEGRKTE